MKKHTLLFLVLAQAFCLFGQDTRFFVQGKITEKSSQENLIGANVRVLEDAYMTSSDAFGFYQLRLPKGKYKILVSYVGYRSDTLTMNVQQDTTLDISLDAIGLETVQVNAQKIDLQERIGITSLPIQQIKSIPALLGEPDVLRALAMLPGVSNGTEGSVGLNVRGGSPDQNLILIDGAAVYNATHIFGFLSSFNTDAVKKVTLYKGDFPAQYGGRLSSVIDINFKDGNKEKLNIEFGIGVLNSKFFIEGPIKKYRSSFMLAARGSYLDIVNGRAKRNFYATGNGNGGSYTNYRFNDFNAKVNFLIGKNGSLTMGYFHSQDFFVFADKVKPGFISENIIRWSNDVANIRYFQPLGKKIVYNTQLTFNRYDYNFQYNSIIKPELADDADIDFNSFTNIFDVGYKNHFNWSISDKLSASFGTEVYQQFFEPNNYRTIIDGINVNPDSNVVVPTRKSFSAAIFADLKTQWTTQFSTQIGARLANYHVDKTNYKFIEPRFTSVFNFNTKNSLKGSIAVMNQPLHLLSNTTLGYTNDAWVPATKLTPPENALQYSLGFIHAIPRWNVNVSIEGFYKKMNGLIEYNDGSIPLLDNATKGYEKIVQKNGQGRAYGLEFFIHKEVGRFNGLIEYTLSRSERQFNTINFANWYPSRFDRTHDFGTTLNYELSKKWSISSSFVYSTGTPFSGPNYFYATGNEWFGFDKYTDFAHYYKSKNNLRLPAYHRMDIGITYKKIKNRKFDQFWSFGAYNAYNRKNIIATRYVTDRRYKDNIVPPTLENGLSIYGAFRSRSLFPFIPYLTYTLKLK